MSVSNKLSENVHKSGQSTNGRLCPYQRTCLTLSLLLTLYVNVVVGVFFFLLIFTFVSRIRRVVGQVRPRPVSLGVQSARYRAFNSFPLHSCPAAPLSSGKRKRKQDCTVDREIRGRQEGYSTWTKCWIRFLQQLAEDEGTLLLSEIITQFKL